MRKELKKRGIEGLTVLYSKEKPIDISEAASEEDKGERRSVPGSVSFVPPVAGLMIAGEVMEISVDVHKEGNEEMDLFEYAREKQKETESPLASRLRPETLEEVVGQQHIIGKDKLFYRAIKADKLTSVIFYGLPGTGKTTLAKVIANAAAQNSARSMPRWLGRRIWKRSLRKPSGHGGCTQTQKTILFIDEIHRFHKGQQDYLLATCGGWDGDSDRSYDGESVF